MGLILFFRVFAGMVCQLFFLLKDLFKYRFGLPLLSIQFYQMNNFYLFEHKASPSNLASLKIKEDNKRLVALRYNSEDYQIVHLLYGKVRLPGNNLKDYEQYYLYTWNTNSNSIIGEYRSTAWNCTINCQITATASLLLVEDSRNAFLYRLNSGYNTTEMLASYPKASIPILNETAVIRKKADVYKNTFVFTSACCIETKTYSNSTVVANKFMLPQNYHFNLNNIALDTKLFENRLYILFRNLVSYEIYLYEFANFKSLLVPFTNATFLNQTAVQITEIFRFNNLYRSKIIRFVRGINRKTNKFIYWAYNENEAYKCANGICIGNGYETYGNIIFSSIAPTRYSLAFYGKTDHLILKSFKPSLVQEFLGDFVFKDKKVLSLVDMTYTSSNSNKLVIYQRDSPFPREYEITRDCHTKQAVNFTNFCECQQPYSYDITLQKCTNRLYLDEQVIFSSFYIIAIVLSSVLCLTVIFVLYKKYWAGKLVRKSWKYCAAEHIVFQ